VVLLPDWDGAFVQSLGFTQEVSERLGAAVFSKDGTLLGTAQGDDVAARVEELLAGV
jgi:hypothetical protein